MHPPPDRLRLLRADAYLERYDVRLASTNRRSEVHCLRDGFPCRHSKFPVRMQAVTSEKVSCFRGLCQRGVRVLKLSAEVSSRRQEAAHSLLDACMAISVAERWLYPVPMS